MGDGISTDLCKDVTAYTFPDMCMPNADYAGEYPSVTENPDGTSTTSTQKYDDTRPKDGKNSPQNFKFNEAFKVRTGDYLGYKIQPKTPQTLKVKTEMCAAVAAGTAFDRNAKGDTVHGELASTTSWQYFGGQETGLFAQYPASAKTQCWCDKYDPRYRPWYAAAVTGPKDMILVLDMSGSMRDKVRVKKATEDGEEEEEEVERLEIMKEAAIAQLDTVTFSDFIQVVLYSSGAESMKTSLMRGTTENKKTLIEYIRNIKAGGGTCGKCGIEKAFDIFRNSRNSNPGTSQNTAGCERIISFLTDGKMQNSDWVRNGWLDGQKANLPGPSPHIFTYALGNGADEKVPAQLACDNRGWFSKIDDGYPAALKHAMIRYFEYFANKIPSGNSSMIPRWTEFYLDSSGQGKMTTVALPVYTRSSSGKRTFHGVVGIDVLATDFGASLDDSVLSTKLQQRSSQCVVYDFNVTEDASKVIEPKTTTNVDGTLCQIKKLEPKAPFIPTGATINEVDDGKCKSFDAGLILAIVLPILLCCCCFAVGYWCYSKRRATSNKNSNVQQAKNVQMTAANFHGQQQQHGGAHFVNHQMPNQQHGGARFSNHQMPNTLVMQHQNQMRGSVIMPPQAGMQPQMVQQNVAPMQMGMAGGQQQPNGMVMGGMNHNNGLMMNQNNNVAPIIVQATPIVHNNNNRN